MPLSRSAVLLSVLGMAVSTASAQAIFSPRASALGAYGALVQDARGFTADPAGLVGMKDWDIYTTTYAPTAGSGQGFTFSGVGAGKRFFGSHALAFQYTPGITLDVVKLATFRISGFNLATDSLITYTEPVAAAYAYRAADNLSFGVQARMQSERITAHTYTIQAINDSLNAVLPAQQEFYRATWFGDLAALWKPESRVSISGLWKGLVRFNGRGFPPELDQYTLPRRRSAEIAASWTPLPGLVLAGQGSTDGRGSLGAEWMPWRDLSLRAGLYGDADQSPFVSALGAGLGWSYLFLEADLSYLRFTNRSQRTGAVSSSTFDASEIKDLGMNPYTGDRASFSLRAMLGNLREGIIRIEGVEMLGGVYPSAFQALAFRPIGKVRVRNTSARPVEARASFFVDRLMDHPTQSPPANLQPGESVDIPLTAIFNESVKNVSSVSIREGTVSVSAALIEEYDDRTQARVLIHGRNDWDGTTASLRYFVTPDDPEVIRTAREILVRGKDSLAGVPAELGALRRAKLVCDAFTGKLVYVSDPKHLTEFVQYSRETLGTLAGDCTDLTVCFASLLSSVGISTAFVDVVPPQHPEKSHIFLLFDTGISPKFGDHVSSNPKRYILRRSKSGEETIWLPIESTAITRGFDVAWTEGAQQYFDVVELGLGLVGGWVHIVDVY